MDYLLHAINELVCRLPSTRVEAIADRIRASGEACDPSSLNDIVGTPASRLLIQKMFSAWKITNEINQVALSGMISSANFVRRRAENETSVELVLTGPNTRFVASRRTEQVLLDLIRRSERELFIVSFVVRDVHDVLKELAAASARGVKVRVLVESSKTKGGTLNDDQTRKAIKLAPLLEIYEWQAREAPFNGGKVHAKIAVADGMRAFLTSANLTGHALEKNIEAGVLINGGKVAKDLQDHLMALIEESIIVKSL